VDCLLNSRSWRPSEKENVTGAGPAKRRTNAYLQNFREPLLLGLNQQENARFREFDQLVMCVC